MKFPIFCLVLLGLLSLSWADHKAEADPIEKECIAETKTNEKEVHEFFEPNFNFDKTTPNMKCFLKCIMVKLDHLNHGGILNAEKAFKDWNDFTGKDGIPKLSIKSFETCKKEEGANDCETAFKINKCLMQQ